MQAPVAFQRRQQDRQQRPQALAAYPVGGLPEHDQCGPYRLVIQRGARTGLPLPDGRLSVQRSNRRLLVIAGHRDELIEYLSLVSARCRAISSSNCVGQLGPRRSCHLGAHSPSEVVEALWWQACSPVTSQLRQLPQLVTLLMKQRGGEAEDSHPQSIPCFPERTVMGGRFGSIPLGEFGPLDRPNDRFREEHPATRRTDIDSQSSQR